MKHVKKISQKVRQVLVNETRKENLAESEMKHVKKISQKVRQVLVNETRKEDLAERETGSR
jgi:hypothetical protein